MWQMNRISKNTLLNISKYSNKLIKLAKYIQESNQPIIINELSSVDSLTDQVQLLEAFDKDLIKNVNDLYELQKLLITVQDDGTIPELNGEEKNIKILFGESYDEKNKLLNLPSSVINIERPQEKESIKAQILKNFLGIDPKEYKLLLKTKDKLKEISISELTETTDKIKYIINKSDIDFVSKYTKKIGDLVNSIFEIRKNLDLEEKDLIDTRISSGRTMIDGVLELSTYISKNEGIYNISNKHKGFEDVIEKIYQAVKESKYIAGIEIDQDTDVNKVLFIVNQVKNLHLNVDKEFEFKIRKLGNYRYNGMYIHDDINVAEFGFTSNILNIVSVDVNAPTALIHELVHLVDLSNDDFSKSPNRRRMINYFSQKLIDNGIKEYYSKLDYEYLLKGNEIIARLGEIGYILNKYDYRGHETKEDLMDFFDKVKQCQKLEEKGVIIPENLSELDFELFKQKQSLIKKFDSTFINENEKFIPVVKNIDFYRINKNSFFDIENLMQEELMLIKNYSKSYFNVIKNEFAKLDNLEVLQQTFLENEVIEKEKPKSLRRKYNTDDFIFSKINTLNIDNILLELDKNEVISWKEFLIEYGSQRHHLFRSSFSLNEDKRLSQHQLNNKIVDHLINNNDEENLIHFINSYLMGVTSMDRSFKNVALILNKDLKPLKDKDLKVVEENLYNLPEVIKKALKYFDIKSIDIRIGNFRPQIEVDKLALKNVFSEIELTLDRFKPTDLLFIKLFTSTLLRLDEYNTINYNKSLNQIDFISEYIDNISIENMEKMRELINSEIVRHNEPLMELCMKDIKECIDNKRDYVYNYDGKYYGRKSCVSFKDINEDFIKNNLKEILELIDISTLNNYQREIYEDDKFKFVCNNLLFRNLKTEGSLELLEKLKIEDINEDSKCLYHNHSYKNLIYTFKNENTITKAEEKIFEKMLEDKGKKTNVEYIENFKKHLEQQFKIIKTSIKAENAYDTAWCIESREFSLKLIGKLIKSGDIDNYNNSLHNYNILKSIKRVLNLNPDFKYDTKELIDSYKNLTMSKSRTLKI